MPSRFSLLVVAAGVAGGIAGAGYLALLMVAERLLGPDHWPAGPHLVILVGVGVAVAAVVAKAGPTSNVELLVDDIHVIGGRYELRTLRSLIPVSLLCVGAGGTIGPEAPLVQTTGALAGRLGHRFGVDQRRLRVLTITGMAAGFTALFGSPIGATIFALEIPHRRGIEHHEAILPASVGAMAGYAVYVVASGHGLEPIFDLPGVASLHLADLAWAAVGGVLSAVVAYAFALGVKAARSLTGRLPQTTRPAVAGAALGLLALANPHVLTNGETVLHDMVTGPLVVGTLLLAAAAKLVGAVVCVAGEWRGGFIIPLFFAGAMVGSAVHAAVPSTNQWVLVTAMMVGCNVGVTKTPLGSALVVTEMAGIRLLPTVMLASLVALALTGPLRVIETQRHRQEVEAAR